MKTIAHIVKTTTFSLGKHITKIKYIFNYFPVLIKKFKQLYNERLIKKKSSFKIRN